MKNFSKIILIVTCSILSIYRINVTHKKEIGWDVLGYYLYLPATFIHHDPMLNDITWLKQINEEQQLTGTLYMVSQNEKGEHMYFFLMGMALFYLPFFMAGSAFASLSGFPVDGFSLPYQYSLVVGGIIYTIIGLIFLRKILRRFFPEGISALIMVIIVFGTNYINHFTNDNLTTVNIIFMLTSIVIWNTIKWHENLKGKHLVVSGICVTLLALVKPTEVFVFIIPLLWNVSSKETMKQKIALLVANKKYIFLAMGIGLLIVMPQMLYWFNKTGKFIYDSYKNPGVGLDVFSPHIMDVLFSYRKGWLIYTPIMIFSVIGFYFLYKNNRPIFYSCAVYFFVSFYIISSWSEWWYGAGFSIRPLISTYPVLAICLGYFLLYLSKKSFVIKTTFATVAVLFLLLNQFQWWQLKNWILDPYRTTKEYYWATFLKTSVTESDQKLLSVYRDFSGKMEFTEEHLYQKIPLVNINFDEADTLGNQIEGANHFYRFKEDQDFFQIMKKSYREITSTDHLWIKMSMDVRYPENFEGILPSLVNSMSRKNGLYGYSAREISTDSLPNNWKRIEFIWITPQIRSTKDFVNCDIWKRGKSVFDVDNITVDAYKRE